MVALPGNIHALTAEQQEKLLAAQRVAERVYDKTKNADGAVKVLEEAGIELLTQAGSAALRDPVNLGLLEAYAGYLTYVDKRQQDAATHLKTVLKVDPDRASAYLALGDLYYARYEQQPQAQYQRIYKNAYKKYVAKLIKQGESIILPEKIIRVVYGEVRDICGLLQAATSKGRVPELARFMNPETKVGQKTTADPAKGTSLIGLFKVAEGAVRYSELDVDNDGYQEQRYTANLLDGCQRNLFYRETAGGFAYYSNALFDEYYKPTTICGQSRVFPLRFKEKNYLIEHKVGQGEPETVKAFAVEPAGEARQLCELKAGPKSKPVQASLNQPKSELQSNLRVQCEEAVCERLAAKIDDIVAADGQVGVEWLVSDIAAHDFSNDIDLNTALDPYVKSPHQYLVDLNNDGNKELVARHWQQTDQGLRYSHRLFYESNGQWNQWLWPGLVPADKAVAIADNIWFFVERMNNSHYLVTYDVRRSADQLQYQLRVYHIDSGAMRYLGRLQTQQSQSQ